MKILLLGATGLLGHNVLRLLLERGYSVVALVRDRARIVLPDAVRDTPQLTIVTGSLLDEGDLRHAASGCDAIVNCAGTTDMSLLRYADYLPVNRQLVENLLEIIDEKDMIFLPNAVKSDLWDPSNKAAGATMEIVNNEEDK